MLPEPDPDSTTPISTTVDINIPFDDKSPDNENDPNEDDDAFDASPIPVDNNSIVFVMLPPFLMMDSQ